MTTIPEYRRRRVVENVGVIRTNKSGGGGLAAGIGRVASDLSSLNAEYQREREKQEIATASDEGQAAAAALEIDAGTGAVKPAFRDNATAVNRAFNKAIETGALARFELDQKRRAAEFRSEAGDDLAKFEAKWSGHAKGVLEALPGGLKPAAQLLLARLGTEHVNGIITAERSRARAQSHQDWEAGVAADEERLTALAAAGQTQHHAYAEAMNIYIGRLASGVDSQFVGPEAAALRREQLADLGEAKALAFRAVEAAKKAGPGAAGEERLNRELQALQDPELRIPEARRRQVDAEARQAWGRIEAERQHRADEVWSAAETNLNRLHLGINVAPGVIARDVQALRAVGAHDRAARLEDAALVQGELSALTKLPIGQIDARLDDLQKRFDDGTASEVEGRLTRALAPARNAKARAMADDAFGTAAKAHPELVGKVEPVEWAKPAAEIAAALRTRLGQAEKLANYEGVSVPPLTTEEFGRLAQAISVMNAGQKAELLAGLADGLGPKHLPRLLSVIARKDAKDDNQPGDVGVFAAAAGIAMQDRETARQILFGMDVLKANKGALPADDINLRTRIDQRLGDAFAARPDARGMVVEAAKALYAFEAGQKGDFTGKLDGERLVNALDGVTGGILRFNGGALVAPRRGMTQRDFDALMDGLPASAIAGARAADGRHIDADMIRRHGRLTSVGDGRYTVAVAGFDALDAQGRQFVLDLRNAEPDTEARRPRPNDLGLPKKPK